MVKPVENLSKQKADTDYKTHIIQETISQLPGRKKGEEEKNEKTQKTKKQQKTKQNKKGKRHVDQEKGNERTDVTSSS